MTYGREQEDTADPEGSNNTEQQVPGYRVQELCRELASGEVTRANLARKYGVNRSSITRFARRHRGRIEEIRRNLDDEFAATWIASKTRRIEALQADYEASAGSYYTVHYEHIKARTAILRAVAEELGQIPNKSSVTIGGFVRHELVGVDVSECFPAAEPEENEEEP